MKSKTQRFHFVVGAVTLSVISIGLIVTAYLAEPNFFRPKMTAETYFVNSINGLEPGTPIKFRGVPVGEVKEVKLSSEVYPGYRIPTFSEYNSLAVVRMILYFDQEKFDREYVDYIKKGLRVQTQLAGLTGTLYISLEFIDPHRFPADRVAYPWNPAYKVIPSAPSLTNQIEGNVKRFLADLDALKLHVRISSTVPTVKSLLIHLNDIASQLSGQQFNAILHDAGQFLDLASLKVETFDIKSLNELVSQIDASAKDLQGNFFAKETEDLVKQINRLTAKFNNMGNVNQYELRSLMNSLVYITENLASLTRQLNEDPGSLFEKRESSSGLPKNF